MLSVMIDGVKDVASAIIRILTSGVPIKTGEAASISESS